ncbi:MAG: hypothetical protein JKP90_16410 [Desulfofustis sp. PB-SRB1]|nr:hypothetical protein [Desulfofustis sp. PB-SRB1]
MSRGKETGYLVLNRWGTKMTPTAVWAVVKKAAKEAKIRKNVTTTPSVTPVRPIC